MPKKPTITLAELWTYRTPAVTIHYPAGKHSVSQEIADAAPKQKAKTNGKTSSVAEIDAASTDSASEG